MGESVTIEVETQKIQITFKGRALKKLKQMKDYNNKNYTQLINDLIIKNKGLQV